MPTHRTIPRMFEESVTRFASKVMMWEKKGEKYEGTTCKEIRQAVDEYAAEIVRLKSAS